MSQTLGTTRLAHARIWHHIDVGATPLPLGRIASRIAITLMGKHKPVYNPGADVGDYVVATGCNDLTVTGKKKTQKLYRTHTTRPGSLKEINMEGLMGKLGGGEVLRRAVRGMLPKNKLRDKRLARLKVFEGLAHPYEKNIIRYPEGQKVGESLASLPEVRQAFVDAERIKSGGSTVESL